MFWHELNIFVASQKKWTKDDARKKSFVTKKKLNKKGSAKSNGDKDLDSKDDMTATKPSDIKT